ncbi:MAG: hypothetical protein A2284_07790 [Deltaproteobacteria bacterium RIFOXYA12_FULL_61_11]|nr:MAG: hypothetical protein A2284_07790 [Deltaproteobacteria bacterium RIFOXYA12_FULL_61_11]
MHGRIGLSNWKDLFLLGSCCVLFVLLSSNLESRDNATQTLEDAHIHYKYSLNLARGNGLVYNADDPVESYSNLLWVLLLGGFMTLGLGPVLISTVLSLVSGVLLFLYLWRRSIRGGNQEYPTWASLLLLFALGTNHYFTAWVLGGFETIMFALLVTLTVLETVDDFRRGTDRWALVLLVILCYLTRAEGASVLGFYVGTKALQYHRQRRTLGRFLVRVVVPLASTVVGIILLRYAYYGLPFSNVYYSKCFQLNYFSGVTYLHSFLADVGPFLLVLGAVPLLAIALVGQRELRLLAAFVVLWPLQHVLTSGDYWPYYRYYAPVLPLLFYVAVRGMLLVPRLYPHPLTRPLGPLLLVLFVLGWQLHPVAGAASHVNLTYRFGTLYDFRGLYLEKELGKDEKTLNLRNLGQWLYDHTPPGSVVAMEAVGLTGFYSDRIVLDYLGLMNADIAQLNEPGKAIEYTMARRPDNIVLHLYDTPAELAGTPTMELGRFLVAHPDFQADYALAIRLPFKRGEMRHFTMLPPELTSAATNTSMAVYRRIEPTETIPGIGLPE